MKYLLFILFIVLTGCAASQQQVEKKIEQCIITKTENTYDSEGKINASNLAIGFEDLLLEEELLVDKSPKSYRDLLDLLTEEKMDSLELDRVLLTAYQKNLGIIYNPAFYAGGYACVTEAQQKFPKVFEASESLQGLYQSFEKLQQTNDLEVFVTTITDEVPSAQFQSKVVYRLPVITAIYSIMEQTYSRYRNPAQDE